MKKKIVKPPIDYQEMIRDAQEKLKEYERRGHNEADKIREFIKEIQAKANK